MKKAVTILTLPILDVLEGKSIGQAQNIIVNPDTKDVYLVLEGTRVGNISLLNIKDVLGIGNDYILLKSITSIKKINEYKELVQELSDSFSLIGIPVVSTSGNILGKVIDFEIDEKKGDIASIELDNHVEFKENHIYSICEKYVFVDEDAEVISAAAEETESAAVVSGDVQNANSSESVTAETSPASEATSRKAQEEQHQEPKNAVKETISSAEEYLIGLTLQRDIVSKDGLYDVKAGTVLTLEMVKEAQKHDALVLLATNAE